jgi:uridine kinase
VKGSHTAVIGIGGGSASGKSTLARYLAEYAGVDERAIIRVDDYYHAQDDLPAKERECINYDHPNSLELGLLIQHLRDLKSGLAVECPVYDFTAHTRRRDVTRHIEPSSFLIIEGNLVLAIPALRQVCDVAIFIDIPDQVRFERRLARDMSERGRTEQQVRSQWDVTVQPMFREFCEVSRDYADIVFDGIAFSRDDVAMLWGSAKQLCAERLSSPR